MLQNATVVGGGVNAGLLGHSPVVREEVAVAAVVHEGRRHDDPAAHHVGQRAHRAVRVDLEQLPHDSRVGQLVPLLVGGDGAAYARERQVAVLLRATSHVAVGDGGGALLEGDVDEAVVGAPRRGQDHAGVDEVVDGPLDLRHVDAAGEEEVPIEHVAVPVLLGGPASGPARPCGAAGACEIMHGLEAVRHALVTRERLLRHHVAHEAHQVRVGQTGRAGADVAACRVEAVGAQRRRVRQQVRRLPRHLRGLKERHHVRLRPRLQLVEHL